MGFTRYWRRVKHIPARKFAAASRDCRIVLGHLDRQHGIKVQYEYDDERPPEFSNDQIRFNGPGELGHETFLVEKTYVSHEGSTPSVTQLWFQFCKTARKPYDAAVAACLIVLRHHLGERFLVSSDGDEQVEGLPLARQACQQVLGHGGDFSQLASGVERLVRAGLQLEKIPSDQRHVSALYRLANGWLIEKVNHGTRLAGSPKLTVVDPYRQDCKSPLACHSLAEARWLTTVAYLSELLQEEPNGSAAIDVVPYLTDAGSHLQNWTPIGALADALEDADDLRYRLLRALLPRKL